jgi:hypothetical protein
MDANANPDLRNAEGSLMVKNSDATGTLLTPTVSLIKDDIQSTPNHKRNQRIAAAVLGAVIALCFGLGIHIG